MIKVRVTDLTNQEKIKKIRDLKFLAVFLKECKEKNFRVVVSGGYGLDGVLGGITRPHNDLDLIVYGNIARNNATKVLTKIIETIYQNCQIKIIDENKFYLELEVNKKGFGANIYFVETANSPVKDINTIKTKDGQLQVNSSWRFPLPVKAKINKLSFEAQNPNLHLADILFKRKKKTNLLKKHEQDIQNLKQITNKRIVEDILSKY